MTTPNKHTQQKTCEQKRHEFPNIVTRTKRNHVKQKETTNQPTKQQTTTKTNKQ